jgi:transposase
MDATTVAVDVAKTVFEVAIADRQWHIVARHRFNRRQFTHFLATVSPTHIVMEACGTAHFWGRFAQKHNHRVTLLPPAYVRPYVRRNKTDRTDAEALLEATRSGQIPSVAVKSVAQQTVLALHRIRDQWMTTRTARINALRGILREQGLLLPAGAGPALRAIWRPTALSSRGSEYCCRPAGSSAARRAILRLAQSIAWPHSRRRAHYSTPARDATLRVTTGNGRVLCSASMRGAAAAAVDPATGDEGRFFERRTCG